MNKEAIVTLVEPVVTAEGRDKFDVYSKFRLPPRAIGYLHAILQQEGYDQVVSIVPHLNDPQGSLTEADVERIKHSDYLLLSAITRTILEAESLAKRYKGWNPQGRVIIGGPHATFQPEECLGFADVVVRGEGERTLPELLMSLAHNRRPEGVLGVSYKRNGEVIHEPNRPFLTEDELSRLPTPFYDSNLKSRIGVNTIITSRGCPYDCSFCSVTKFYGRRYRRRSNESILEELADYSDQPKKHIFFADDNFYVKPEETNGLLCQMKDNGFSTRNYSAQVRIEAASDKEFLTLWPQTRGKIVYIGIESINDETLQQYHKRTTAKDNKEAVRRFREAGIWVHGMLIVGGDGDTPETLKETLQWARANLDSVQFFTHMLLPGTDFTRQMEEEGRILVKDWRYNDGHHVLLRPKNFTPYELQLAILEMYKEFYSPWDIGHILRSKIRKIDIGLRLYARFQLGLNTTEKDPEMVAYLRMLRELS